MRESLGESLLRRTLCLSPGGGQARSEHAVCVGGPTVTSLSTSLVVAGTYRHTRRGGVIVFSAVDTAAMVAETPATPALLRSHTVAIAAASSATATREKVNAQLSRANSVGCRTVRHGDGVNDPWDPDLPIIMLSAKEHTDRVRGLTRGAHDHVTRPVSHLPGADEPRAHMWESPMRGERDGATILMIARICAR
jgi:hypothetical protein